VINAIRNRPLIFFLPSILIATGVLIGIYVSEGEPSEGQQVEPLICQELAQSQSLPPGKRDVLRRGCEQAKAARASGPRATVPVVTPARVNPVGEATSSPSPSPYVDLAGVRSCQVGDLTSGYEGGNGAMMSVFSWYGFGNSSESPCKLDGPPDVRLIDAAGSELPTVASSQPPCPGSDFCIEKGAFLLRAGMGEIVFGQLEPGQASILLVWRNHDGAMDCGSPRTTKIRFIFPNGSQVDGEVPESRNMSPCNGQVEIWGFGPVDQASN